MSNPSIVANFIIGGTEKAGTTSVFTYLSAHPEVCGSNVKETDFFRKTYSGDRSADIAQYSAYFDRCRAGVKIIMEASPGYLGAGAIVAPRIRELSPDAKILFILRDPIDRLYSSFQFHLARLDIDQSIGFDEYVDRCIRFDAGAASAGELGIGDWYLRNLGFGRYAEPLSHYFQHFPRQQIKLMFFEQLNDDVVLFMRDLSQFLDIAPDFYDQYEFKRVNVTFSGKSKLLHWLAVRLNEQAESFLRQRPGVKQKLVALYKTINQKQEGYAPMDANVRAQLEAYYKPSNDALRNMVSANAALPPWLQP